MYLMAKSDKHARRMVIIPIIGSIVGPLIWIIPPLAAIILFPNLATDPDYAMLTERTEAAFVVVAMKLMPVGLLGLLLCAMIGATLTSMDAAVNKGVASSSRSFYLPIINPPRFGKAPADRWGKLCTLGFGLVIIGRGGAGQPLPQQGPVQPDEPGGREPHRAAGAADFLRTVLSPDAGPGPRGSPPSPVS